MKSTVSLQYEYIYHFRSYNSVFRHLWWGLQGELSIRGWSHRAVPTPSVSISGCNSEKMVGNHLFLNIIPSNFTAKTERKVWCDRGMRVYDSMNLQWIPLAPMHKSEQLTIHSNLVGRSHPSTWVVGSGSINESATSNKNNNIVFPSWYCTRAISKVVSGAFSYIEVGVLHPFGSGGERSHPSTY